MILASSWASMANPMPDNCQEPGWPKTGVSTWRQAGEQLTWEETFFPHLHRDAHRGLAYLYVLQNNNLILKGGAEGLLSAKYEKLQAEVL